MSQPILSVLSKDRDLVLCGEAGLGGLLKVELLEAVEWRGESESWRKELEILDDPFHKVNWDAYDR